MLSDNDILKAIEAGELAITPFDSTQLRPAAISLSLGKQILVPKPMELIDFKQEAELEYDEQIITADTPFILRPQQFVLGHTEEIISVGTTLGFIIEGRSTLARLGVSMEQSSTIVDSGHYERPITLEMYNCGPSPVTLYRGMSVARAVVFRLSSKTGKAIDAYIRYASQKTGAGKPILRMKSSQ